MIREKGMDRSEHIVWNIHRINKAYKTVHLLDGVAINNKSPAIVEDIALTR